MSRRALLAAALVVAASAAPAQSTNFPVRTYVVSAGLNNGLSTGASTRPSLSASGTEVAFDSVATNLTLDTNGEVRDVFLRNVPADETRLISQAPNGDGADGPSSNASLGGSVVAFQSDATNLVAGDGNGLRDVFARGKKGPVVRVSVAAGGGDPNGPSADADISADGRFIAFISSASNLVPNDGNNLPDVFVRDLTTGSTVLVSQRGGVPADGPSSAPAISPDGGFVSFSSVAKNLVDNDANDLQDVFLADLKRARVERVSVSGSEREQNRSVIEPFPQISDVARGGRFVTFDSDATNLVKGDRNRDTDVFVRDRKRGRTQRVSLDRFGFEGDNDSFNPSISPDGRFVVFQSFASRLAPGGGPKEDVFLYDRAIFAPTVLSVGSHGQRRAKELARQLLQRPKISSNGLLAAFSSTAPNLVGGDDNKAEDIFLRVTVPGKAKLVAGLRGTVRSRTPQLRLSADDHQVTDFLCTLDGVRIVCGRKTTLPRIGPGQHVLKVRAGGPGMLFQTTPLVRVFRVAG
jgi:Tol biopolymer transport system component